LVGLFVLPAAIFYMMVYGGYHRVHRLRFYGPHNTVTRTQRGQSVVDTIYFTLTPFSGLDYLGRPYHSDSLLGYVTLVHVLDGRIFRALPKEIVYFGSEALGTFPDLRMVTIFRNRFPADFSFPSRLTSRLAKDSLRWHFVVLDSASCDLLIRQGLFATENPDSLAYDPAGIALLDKEHHIRGYYNPVLLADINDMKKEVQHLYKEYELAFKTHRLVRFVD
jgi:hypothetical protein